MIARRPLNIDSTVGGLGDIWMRLNALYSLAALIPEVNVQLRIPKPLLKVSGLLWPDRFQVTASKLSGSIEITHLGLRHLAPRLLTGQRFLSPFYQIHRADRKATTIKHRVNEALIQFVKIGGALHIPTAASVDGYQGYHEFSAIPEFSMVSYEWFVKQAKEDFLDIRSRMQSVWPKCADPKWQVLVLPSGTGHQIMPPDWAQTHLSQVTYAFHEKDSYRLEFESRGMQVVAFENVEGLLALSAQAGRTVATDSFPSHPLQNYSGSTVVALSQQPRSRIVHPAFDGRVIHSRAKCCPCANRARGVGACDIGRDFCITWSDEDYVQELLTGIS